MKKIMIAALFAVAVMLTQSTIQAQPYYYDWINSGTGDWSEAANWNNGVPALVPGNDIYIGTGGRAEITWETYENLGGDPRADIVTVTNGSTLYMDSYLEGVKQVILSGGSQLIQTPYGEINYFGGQSAKISLTGYSTITVAGSVWAAYAYGGVTHITGDSTGTIFIGDNGGGGLDNYVEVSNVNLQTTGNIAVSNLSGTSNVTVTSGTLLVANMETGNQGGNVTIAGGAKLQTNYEVGIKSGYLLSGGGTVDSSNGSVHIYNGGRLDTSISFDSGSSGGFGYLALDSGAILVFAEDSPLTILGTNFEMDTWGTVFVDFSSSSLVDGNDYVIIDWTGVTNMREDYFDVNAFTATNLGPDMGGSFTVEGSQLTFTAGAVPEPSTYFLMGAGLGLLLLAARYRRKVQTGA
jgi:hypothetical protein